MHRKRIKLDVEKLNNLFREKKKTMEKYIEYRKISPRTFFLWKSNGWPDDHYKIVKTEFDYLCSFLRIKREKLMEIAIETITIEKNTTVTVHKD